MADWNDVLQAIQERQRDFITWHRRHGSNADDHALKALFVKHEKERLNAQAGRWDDEEEYDLADCARAIRDALPEVVGLCSK